MTIRFRLRNLTKGAIRYEELKENGVDVADDPTKYAVGTLYIRKQAFPGEPPKSITLTIESAHA